MTESHSGRVGAELWSRRSADLQRGRGGGGIVECRKVEWLCSVAELQSGCRVTELRRRRAAEVQSVRVTECKSYGRVKLRSHRGGELRK